MSLNEINDFRHCINTCNLTDLGFKGSVYTWWNGRGEDDCIFKRLDRCLGNLELPQKWPNIEVTHLSKTGSDHSPMILKFDPDVAPIKKAFKFLNFWCKHITFKEVVIQNWTADFIGDPFYMFNHKLKKLKKHYRYGVGQRMETYSKKLLVWKRWLLYMKHSLKGFLHTKIERGYKRCKQSLFDIWHWRKNFGDKSREWHGSRMVTEIRSSFMLRSMVGEEDYS